MRLVVMRGTRFNQEHHKDNDGKLQDSLHDFKLNVSKSSLIGPTAQTGRQLVQYFTGIILLFEAMLLN
jgi:hypothetical protein